MKLEKRYSPGKFHSADPFRALISTVLSQRTRDEVTERAAEKLFSKYGTPAALAHAGVEDIEELIREVGFYRVKAPRVKEIAEKYNGTLMLRSHKGLITFHRKITSRTTVPFSGTHISIYLRENRRLL